MERRQIWIAPVLAAVLVVAELMTVQTPASAGAKLITYTSSSCGSPGWVGGNGQAYPTGSTVVAMTTRVNGGASCQYRAVQLNWWNGSAYVATGWTESYSMTAAVGASASFGWAQHRLGYGPAGYAYEETSSWL